jgi:DNA-binding NarL/FixJ family response regulator
MTYADFISQLTPRERVALALVMAGKTNRGIAAEMHITVRTAKFFVGRLLFKSGGCQTRTELVYRFGGGSS